MPDSRQLSDRWTPVHEAREDLTSAELQREMDAGRGDRCPGCDGSGSIEVPAMGSWEEHGTIYAECPRCGGSGVAREALNGGQSDDA